MIQPGPFQIDQLEALPYPGIIGISICPGHRGRPDLGLRDMDEDLAAIRRWGAVGIVTLMQADEMPLISAERLPVAVARSGLPWFHLPISDGDVPDAAFDWQWSSVMPQIDRILGSGDRLLVHCRGGLGRSGVVACRLLIEKGETPEAALRRVRAARPGAVENARQEAYVLALRH